MNDKKYINLNEILKDLKEVNLDIDLSVLVNTTTKELWEFIDSITKKDKLKTTIWVNYKHCVITSKEELERAKSPLRILIHRNN